MNFADRVKETTTSTSADVIALAGAASTFRSFASSLAVGDTKIPVSMDDGKGNWENGAYTLTNTTTLTRTAIYASSNGGAPTVFPAGAKEVFCTLASEALKDLVDELRTEIGAGNSGVRDIAFAVSVPLSIPGQAYMPQTPVTAPLTFTPAAAAVRGALVYLRLIADGVNMPNFSAFKEWGGSLGYDNRTGIVNEVQFFHDGVDSFVSFSQAIGAAPAPIEATAVTLTGPTSGVVNVASTVFTVGTNSARSASVTVTPTPVSGVTFSPTSVTLPAGSSTATFTATPSTTGAKSIAVTNSGGLTNPSAITYTATASATVPAAPTIGTATAGDGFVDVAFTRNSDGGSAVLDSTATLSTGQTATGSSSPIRVTAPNGTAVTATVRDRNVVGSSTASAASNSVTPTAAALARLGQLTNITESGSGPYTYTATTAKYAPDVPGPGGILNKTFGAGIDGSIAVTKGAAVGASNEGSDIILALDPSATLVAFNNLDYALFGEGGVALYKPITGGTIGSGNGSAIAPQTGDICRMRRTGSSLVAEVARSASPSTFTTVHTWSGVSTGTLYVHACAAYQLAISNLTAVGLV